MSKSSGKPSEKPVNKHGPLPFVLAGISFIPLIGVLFGVVCILIALLSRKRNSKLLAILGASGILLTIVLYGVILPSVMMLLGEGYFNKAFEPHASSTLTSLVRVIEYHKLQNKRYPKNLDELRLGLKESEMMLTRDVSGPMKLGGQPRDFYYEVIRGGNNYLLFGKGTDATPFTEDDIYPIIDPAKDKSVGWRKDRQW